jgi:hypothetical protein
MKSKRRRRWLGVVLPTEKDTIEIDIIINKLASELRVAHTIDKVSMKELIHNTHSPKDQRREQQNFERRRGCSSKWRWKPMV